MGELDKRDPACYTCNRDKDMTLDEFRNATVDLPGDTPIVTSLGDHTWTSDREMCVCKLVDEQWGQFGEHGVKPHGPLVTVIAIT